MNPASISDENLDLAILRVLDAGDSQFGFSPKALANLLVAEGYRPDVDQVEKRMHYLGDPELGLVSRVPRGSFHPANAPWRITAKGMNHLREQGF